MAFSGRISDIAAYLRTNKRASVAELAEKFFASQSSIRRDLAELEKNGCVARYYGGAAFVGEADAYDSRISIFSIEKQRIAEKGVEFVSDGQTVFLDSSSTSSFTIQYLARFKGLNIVTNCLDTAIKATRLVNSDIYIAGGNVRSPSFSVVSATAADFFKDFYADVAFFSCTSYRASFGCFEGFKTEVPVKKSIVANAEKAILLCDSSKLEAPSAFASVAKNEIDVMITDSGISSEEKSLIETNKTKLMIV